MSDSEKPEGDLEDADGVTIDSNGNPRLEMEELRKGGSSDKDGRVEKAESNEE